MGIRRWFRERMVGDESEGDDLPPSGALVHAAWNRDPEPVHALGEYDQETYPEELAELVRRRAEVMEELLQVDVTDRDARVAAISRLSQLLRKYPHPLAYEFLINAYVDAERFDEAKGVAFAAQARRLECARSPHPEIRAETDRLNEWSPEEIDQIRAEREANRK